MGLRKKVVGACFLGGDMETERNSRQGTSAALAALLEMKDKIMSKRHTLTGERERPYSDI